ncbi:hypothetical protein BX266_3325 [Streptomyces sp. TLI_171]|nr:hypothetical protein BX266_3325 [Streptomyces sp. TLI_171]
MTARPASGSAPADSSSAGTAPGPALYPLTVPGTDTRFSFGLVFDAAKVLEAHGYPPVTAGPDLVNLRQALFRFLYTPEFP